MEREKGVDTQWIHPTPHHVVKSRLAGLEVVEKVFINVCSSPEIEEASSSMHPTKGQHWSIPHILLSANQGRTDTDKNGNSCKVYDVVFHPTTLIKMRKSDA